MMNVTLSTNSCPECLPTPWRAVINAAMNKQTAVTDSTHSLWQKLTNELADVFDMHGICATAAAEIAAFAGCITVLGIKDPYNSFYNVWICQPDGQTKQTRWETQAASFDPVLKEGKPLWQEKFELSPGELINSELWQLARSGILFAPLPLDSRRYTLTPPGVVCLLDPQADCALNIERIGDLSAYLTVFLDRALLRHRSQQQSVEFDIVSYISYSITSTLDLEDIFKQVADAVRRTLNAESISIGLTDANSGEIVFVDSLMGPLFQSMPPIRLQPGQGIAGWVATHAEPLIVNNVYDDQRFFAKVDQSSGFQTHSILCVPLRVEQRVIGVLEAINKQNGQFNDNDLGLLQAISGPLAVAIENARLHSDVLAEKRRIETLFASMSEGMMTVNDQGWITAANDSLLTLLRTDEAAVFNRRAVEVIDILQGNFAEFMDEVVQQNGQEYPQLAGDLHQADGGYVPVLISGTPIRNPEGESNEAIFVFSDLRQIREVERMRDDFFNNIIHELRTPLATILMYARLLREGKAQDDQAKADRFLGVIERESDRLQRMVRQMLQLAKLEAREMQRSSEPVNVKDILDQLLPTMADRATEKGLTFSQRVPTKLPHTVGNEETLYMIFKNLIENAIKFTLSGTVWLEAWVEGDHLCVEIRDEGIGIPQQALPNMFKRFYRTQTAVERGIAGTGLGLYMVKEGVEKHQGTVELQSVEGEGTTFTVRLPVVEE